MFRGNGGMSTQRVNSDHFKSAVNKCFLTVLPHNLGEICPKKYYCAIQLKNETNTAHVQLEVPHYQPNVMRRHLVARSAIFRLLAKAALELSPAAGGQIGRRPGPCLHGAAWTPSPPPPSRLQPALAAAAPLQAIETITSVYITLNPQKQGPTSPE